MFKSALRYLIALILVSSLVDVMGQQRNTKYDSLIEELNEKHSEAIHLDLLLALSKELMYGDTIEGPGYAKEAIKLAEKLDQKERAIDAKINMGIFWESKALYDRSDPIFAKVNDESRLIGYERGIAWGHFFLAFQQETEEDVLAHLDSALQRFNKIGDKQSFAKMIGEIADVDESLSSEERLEMFERVAKISREIGDPHGEGRAYFEMGQIYGDEGQRKECIDHYFKAVEALPHTSKETIALAYNNIATHLEDQDYSMKYHIQALDIWIEVGSIRRVIVGTSNIGATYYVLEEYEKALEYHKRAEEYNKILGDIGSEIRIAINHGKVYDQLEQYDEAIKYFESARELAIEDEDESGEAWASLSLARVYYKTKKYALALTRVDQALEINQKIGLVKRISECLEVKYEIYSSTGNYKLAFENLEQYKAMSDSIFNEEQTRNITRLIDEHEFQQERDSISFAQEKIQLEYEQEIQRRRTINQAAIGGGVLSLIILLILYRSNQLKKQKNKELFEKNEAISELRDTEKKMAEETLALKERELTTITMLSHERNSILQQLGDQIGGLSDKVDDEVIPDLKEIKRTIKSNLNDESWSGFMVQFEKVHPNFFNALKSKFPVITQHDLRLCAYIKVGMDNKEIANVSNVTTPSVKKSINRLKKKMELDAETDLRAFLMTF